MTCWTCPGSCRASSNSAGSGSTWRPWCPTPCETARPVIEAKGHELTVSLPAEPVALEADPIRLAQALTNLLNNAAKYTEPGGRIALTAVRDGDEVVVGVRDTGVGIAPEMLPRIFELFTQEGRSADRAQGGLGIGLALVKSLVEMHGGASRPAARGWAGAASSSSGCPCRRPRRPSRSGRGRMGREADRGDVGPAAASWWWTTTWTPARAWRSC